MLIDLEYSRILMIQRENGVHGYLRTSHHCGFSGKKNPCSHSKKLTREDFDEEKELKEYMLGIKRLI